MKEIVMARGQKVLVDDEDFDRLNQFKWCLNTYGYAVRAVPHPLGTRRQTLLFMHREILGLEFGDPRIGDHRNRIRSDNQKSNLRICNYRQNSVNATGRSASGFKGVWMESETRRWRSAIRISGKKKSLGYFESAEDASEFYNLVSVMLHGEFAACATAQTN